MSDIPPRRYDLPRIVLLGHAQDPHVYGCAYSDPFCTLAPGSTSLADNPYWMEGMSEQDRRVQWEDFPRGSLLPPPGEFEFRPYGSRFVDANGDAVFVHSRSTFVVERGPNVFLPGKSNLGQRMRQGLRMFDEIPDASHLAFQSGNHGRPINRALDRLAVWAAKVPWPKPAEPPPPELAGFPLPVFHDAGSARKHTPGTVVSTPSIYGYVRYEIW